MSNSRSTSPLSVTIPGRSRSPTGSRSPRRRVDETRNPGLDFSALQRSTPEFYLLQTDNGFVWRTNSTRAHHITVVFANMDLDEAYARSFSKSDLISKQYTNLRKCMTRDPRMKFSPDEYARAFAELVNMENEYIRFNAGNVRVIKYMIEHSVFTTIRLDDICKHRNVVMETASHWRANPVEFRDTMMKLWKLWHPTNQIETILWLNEFFGDDLCPIVWPEKWAHFFQIPREQMIKLVEHTTDVKYLMKNNESLENLTEGDSEDVRLAIEERIRFLLQEYE